MTQEDILGKKVRLGSRNKVGPWFVQTSGTDGDTAEWPEGSVIGVDQEGFRVTVVVRFEDGKILKVGWSQFVKQFRVRS